MVGTVADLLTQPGTQPGTTTSTDNDSPNQRLQLIAPVCLAAAAFLGTGSNVVTTHDTANVLGHQKVWTGTGSAPSSDLSSDSVFQIRGNPSSTEEVVRELQARSGLTWSEFARALGVSRRTAHNWATGKRLSERHAQRLEKFAQLVQNAAGSSPDLTRSNLVAPGTHGVSLLSEFEEGSKPIRQIPLSTLKVGDFFEGDEPALSPEVSQAYPRKSSLRPEYISPRSSGASSA